MSKHLLPLFWQHNESEPVLRDEINKMKEGGIDAFIVEARPHPHYLEDAWWTDIAIILDQAEKQDMKVYIFDDGGYPSGFANGRLSAQYPAQTKLYLAQRHIDAAGPLQDSSFLVSDFLEPGETILAVVCGQRADKVDALLADSLSDITDKMQNGILYWDVPEGDWRIFVLVKTANGAEEHTRSYLNPLTREATRAFIDIVYEPHYSRFKAQFGKTLAGFFSDEPRFGSAASYEATLGLPANVIPWSDDLLAELDAHALGLGAFTRLLPLLWYPADKLTPDVRYVYMDVVSRRFSENFIGQIGNWCRERGVSLIGHFVEENGAHARLGYGAGHYFRAGQGYDMAGIDIVCNLYPGQRDGKFKTLFNYFDADFNHWGLSKMASSEAQLNPLKKGNSFSESFGAYGWSEGLKTMKWITDVICVRGINHITPHAFSPMEYPDTDCPPHFYARGKNPQWRHFGVWSSYAGRLCELLSGGQHVATAAVLYHAEAEWGGAHQPFEKVVKALLKEQIDSTVVPADYLLTADTRVQDRALFVNGKEMHALIIPYSQYLPPALCKRLQAFAQDGLRIIFSGDYPERCYGGTAFDPAGMGSVPTEKLAAHLRSEGICDILAPVDTALAHCHYRKDGTELYFFTNEELGVDVRAVVKLPHTGPVYLYDALTDRRFEAQQTVKDGHSEILLALEPYQSIFVVFAQEQQLEKRVSAADYPQMQTLDGQWRIRLAPYDNPTQFCAPLPETGLFNITAAKSYPDFSGVMQYELDFDCDTEADALLELGRVGEIAAVWLNDVSIGSLICPPYRLEIPKGILRKQGNKLQVEVVNTLVKANHANPFDRFWPQEASGLLGPVVLRTAQ